MPTTTMQQPRKSGELVRTQADCRQPLETTPAHASPPSVRAGTERVHVSTCLHACSKKIRRGTVARTGTYVPSLLLLRGSVEARDLRAFRLPSSAGCRQASPNNEGYARISCSLHLSLDLAWCRSSQLSPGSRKNQERLLFTTRSTFRQTASALVEDGRRWRRQGQGGGANLHHPRLGLSRHSRLC